MEIVLSFTAPLHQCYVAQTQYPLRCCSHPNTEDSFEKQNSQHLLNLTFIERRVSEQSEFKTKEPR